jgi:hypothetical protein
LIERSHYIATTGPLEPLIRCPSDESHRSWLMWMPSGWPTALGNNTSQVVVDDDSNCMLLRWWCPSRNESMQQFFLWVPVVLTVGMMLRLVSLLLSICGQSWTLLYSNAVCYFNSWLSGQDKWCQTRNRIRLDSQMKEQKREIRNIRVSGDGRKTKKGSIFSSSLDATVNL